MAFDRPSGIGKNSHPIYPPRNKSLSGIDNKKLMQEIFAGVAEGDPSMFARHLANNVIMTVTGEYSWSRTFTGKASVLQDLYGRVRSLLKEPGKTIPFRFIADEDWVVAGTW